jgi:hypothetical protein
LKGRKVRMRPSAIRNDLPFVGNPLLIADAIWNTSEVRVGGLFTSRTVLSADNQQAFLCLFSDACPMGGFHSVRSAFIIPAAAQI